MTSLTVDEKLLLIQKMRNHSQDNNNKMQNRDRILRGSEGIIEEQSGMPTSSIFQSLKLRVLLCLLLFAIFITLDRYGISIKGYTATEAVTLLQSPQKIATKEQEKIEVWSEQMVSRILQ